MLRIAAFLSVLFLSSGILPAQEEPDSGGGFGGLFNKLKNVVEDVSSDGDPDEDSGKSWLDRAKELGTSTLEKGKQGFDDLMTSGTDANRKMSEMLSYLDKKLAGREPSFTSEEIQEMAVELIPLVEELNGRKFQSTPKVAITGNFEMIRILGNDLIPQYQKQFPDVSKSSVFLRSYISAGLFAPALMGKYGVTDKAVYVLPENVKAAMEAKEIPAELDRALMKIIIAHELTHALQDQEIDLNKSLMKVSGSEENLAFQALVEGHAVYIQNAAAAKLNLHKAADAGRAILTAPEQEGEEWLVNRVAMADAVKWESIYLGGEKFITHHVEKGGMEKIWSLMEAPPSRTSMIVKPSTYTSGKVAVPDYSNLFEEAPETLGISDWEVKTEAMGAFAILSHLGAVPREQRDSIMKGLNKSALLTFTNNDAEFGNYINAGVFRFATEAGAKQMMSAMEQLNENDIKSAEASVVVDVLSQKKINYDAGAGVTGSAVRYQTKTLVLGEQTTSVIQVRQGNTVAQMMYSGVDLKKQPVDTFLRSAIGKFQK